MNWQGLRIRVAIMAVLVTTLAGCGGAASREWEIAVENRSDAAVGLTVTFGKQSWGIDNSGNASLGKVAKGIPITLVVGPGVTVVRTVKVTRNGEVQELTPNAEIQAGTKYFIVVDADGKASGSVLNR